MREEARINLDEDFHLGVIMDGNGRWASARGLSRLEGHEAGMERIDHLFEAARDFGIRYLTLYAFSNANWKRSEAEVSGLMRLFRRYIARESERIINENGRVIFIGDKSALAPDLVEAMNSLEERSQGNDGLFLQVAMNYGGRDEILRAVNRAFAGGARTIDAKGLEACLDTAGLPDVDLVIRTSGEQRVSDFLIWQAAYAEYYFTPTLWPDFDVDELRRALGEYCKRSRRFGAVLSG